MKPAVTDEMRPRNGETSAKIIYSILSGEETGPRKDVVVLNAAAAIIVSGVADDFVTATKIAKEAIESGRAMAVLKKLIEVSNS
jgi:anthranilate phosphoribosyltransferase